MDGDGRVPVSGATGRGETSPEQSGTAPLSVPEADVFAFSAVQQGGGSRQLRWSSAQLRLVFDARGIELVGESPSEHSFLPWASVTRVSRGESRAAPGGGSVTVIGIDSPGRIMRFAVTSNHRDPIELTALSERVVRWSTSAGAPTEVPGRPVPPATTPGPPPAGPGGPAEPHPDQPAELHSDAGPDPAGRDPAPSPPAEEATIPDPAPGWPPGSPPEAPPSILPFRAPTGPSPIVPSVLAGPPVRGLPPWPGGHDDPTPPRRRWRGRRMVFLGLAVLFLGSGIALPIVLSRQGGSPATAPSTTAPPSSDQMLAEQLMLTPGDLPAGWSVSSDSSGTGSSARIQTGESKITRAFATCMGISDSEATLVLGGAAADQTAQTSSPVFLGPPNPDRPGFALELQTAAAVVRTRQDEQQDFAFLADPRYPQCAGVAFASETQLGADSTSGRKERPGPPSVSALNLPAPPGEQVRGLVVAFTVSDRSASVPIEVEIVSLGHGRIEAELQALAVGGQIPAGVVSPPLAVFAARVAGDGQSAEA